MDAIIQAVAMVLVAVISCGVTWRMYANKRTSKIESTNQEVARLKAKPCPCMPVETLILTVKDHETRLHQGDVRFTELSGKMDTTMAILLRVEQKL